MKKIISLCLIALLMLAPANAFALSLRDIVNTRNAVDIALPQIDGVAVPDLAPFVGADMVISGRYTFTHNPVTTGEVDVVHNSVGYACADSYDAIIDDLIEYSEYAEEFGFELIDAQVDEERVLLEFKNADNLYYLLDWDKSYDANHVYLYFPTQTSLQIDFVIAPVPVLTLANYLGSACKDVEIYEYTSNHITVDGYQYDLPESTEALIAALESYIADMEAGGFTLISKNAEENSFFAYLQHENKGYIYVDWDPEYDAECVNLAFEHNMNFVGAEKLEGVSAPAAPTATIPEAELNTLSAVIDGKQYKYEFSDVSVHDHNGTNYYDVEFMCYEGNEVVSMLSFYFPVTVKSGDIIDAEWSAANNLDWSDVYMYNPTTDTSPHSFVSSSYEYLPDGSFFSLSIDSIDDAICSGHLTATLKEDADSPAITIESGSFSFELPDAVDSPVIAPAAEISIPNPNTFLKTGEGSYVGTESIDGVSYHVYSYTAPTSKLLFNNAVKRYIDELQNPDGAALVYLSEDNDGNGVVFHFFESAAAERLVLIVNKNEATFTLYIQQGSSLVIVE